jgi:NitT/TauT family transport system substrate-binding protein
MRRREWGKLRLRSNLPIIEANRPLAGENCVCGGENRVTRSLLVVIVIGAVLAGSGSLFTGCTAKPEPPLRVGAIVWPGYECLFLARALGKFEQQPVKLVEYPTTAEAIRSFQNGATEVVAMTGDEFLRLSAEEPELRVLLVMDVSKGADALVAKPEFQSIHELKGKRVGVELNSLGVFMLTRALEQGGLSVKDVQIVPVENDRHTEVFEEGKIDAVVTFDPHRAKLLQGGARVLFDSAKIPGEVVDYLVTRESLVKSRPEALRLLLRSWFEARRYLIEHPEGACEKMAAREKLHPAEFAEALKRIDIPSLEENRRMLGSEKKRSFENLQKLHETMLRAGLFKGAMPSGSALEGVLLP